ncbi:hypothetical protein LRS10_10235 [Phenylobacterium sp. J426]|uniref:SO2930 family diheme c-type cytochrome n=1 Tax=Phenylobacterium sp. J426 TaxID=2898439 RepID=UPI00215129A3|nr:SO2930 family diheme c-type cytochrome [Phenylobacterium sp. J426]MCR5874512.1 hypothetical protein [Phenylobacterium sp. J426]
MRRLAAGLAALLCLGAAPVPGPDYTRLVADSPAPKLSDYRLPLKDGGRAAGPGLTPYALNTPLFSDYAEKYRFVGLPPGAKATYRAEGSFDFPVGAVLVKTFAYPADLRRPDERVRSLETRLLIRKADGWVAQAYVWNPEQTDAVLKRAGARIPVEVIDPQGRTRSIDYAVPNQNQCKECHQLDKAISPLGPKARNLNGDFTYASGRRNQIVHWTTAGLLSGAPAPARTPRIARWDDPAEPVAARARAYLDANCAHCHHPNAIASNSGLFLQWEQPEGPALGFGKRPVAAGRGSGGLEVAIAPGKPDASILVHRMASDEPGVMMPELGRSVTHEEGLALVRQWIAEMR